MLKATPNTLFMVLVLASGLALGGGPGSVALAGVRIEKIRIVKSWTGMSPNPVRKDARAGLRILALKEIQTWSHSDPPFPGSPGKRPASSGVIIRPLADLESWAFAGSVRTAGAGSPVEVNGPTRAGPEEIYDPARFQAWEDRQRKILSPPEEDGKWSFEAGLGMALDSNIYPNPTRSNPTTEKPTNKSDLAFLVWAGVEYSTEINGTVKSGLGVGISAKRHLEASDSDLFNWFFGFNLADEWGDLAFSLPYRYSYWYAGSDIQARARVHSLSPALNWRITPEFSSSATLFYENRKYFDGTAGVNRVGLGLSHKYTFGQENKFVRMAYRLDKEYADREGEGVLTFEATLAGGWPIWKSIYLDGGLTFARFMYEDRPALLAGHLGEGDFGRRDNQLRFNLRAFYRLTANWLIGLDYVLTVSGSNVDGGGYDPFRFNKHVLSLGASGRF